MSLLDAAILPSPDAVDLDRHGVIEAHAGTGKTYTIENMVLRILCRKGRDGHYGHVKRLLLVTFTDKAAGELRKRLREGIAARAAQESDPILRAHLADCLNTLHEALIGTIHGVCLRLLQTFPFETGAPFGAEMVDDREGLRAVQREQLRSLWLDANTAIPWAMALLRKQDAAPDSEMLESMVELALQLLDAEHVILDRRACGNLDLPALRARWQGWENEWSSPQMEGFRAEIALYAEGLRRWAKACDDAKRAELLAQKAHALHKALATDSLDAGLVEKLGSLGRAKVFTKESLRYTEAGELQQLLAKIQSSPSGNVLVDKQNLLAWLPQVLRCDAALALRDAWLERKESQGLLSFQDMLRLMERATRSGGFCDALRLRLDFGIIDEFQDTSVLQWNIFRTLFLAGPANGPRLYIVGDPKQSIYSFQGADVRTYLQARRDIVDCGGRYYGLVRNFRSHPDLVAGYNEILGTAALAEDWFVQEGLCYPAPGAGGAMATVPQRSAAPQSLPADPVQVMLYEGGAQERKRAMARDVCQVVRSLLGTEMPVPAGDTWKVRRLGAGDFAVVVENHKAAIPFLDEFQRQGIPCAKYKMEGVFQSPMALDLQVLLRALVVGSADPSAGNSARVAVLFTHFFDRDPSSVVPESDLAPDSDAALALSEWERLTQRRRFGQLFRSIRLVTRIGERLMALPDGERHLADLRQIEAHCLECLLRRNMGLAELLEHLRMLYRQEISLPGDKNLHVLSTGDQCVKVLTMHASKGLEFPVVFCVTGLLASHKRNDMVRWIGADRQLHVAALRGTDGAELYPDEPVSALPSWRLSGGKDAKGLMVEPVAVNGSPALLQALQERRRLLYVALTRPQCLLFVVAQVKEIVYQAPGSPHFGMCVPSSQYQDQDLTPRLLALLQQGRLPLFDPAEWVGKEPAETTGKPLARAEFAQQALEAAALVDRRCRGIDVAALATRQTSYTELSHGQERDRRTSPSEELLEAVPAVPLADGLPMGKDTGDALHLVLEQCLLSADLGSWSLDSMPAGLVDDVRERLDANRVLQRLDAESAHAAACTGALQVHRALTAPLDLSALGCGVIRLCDLALADRRPELEFQLRGERVWVRGFMDLVFRLPAPGSPHPWRYFVLDWKSNALPAYDPPHVNASIQECRYDWQARLYGHALHRFLEGLLGPVYQPAHHLGGAVYVYLRAFSWWNPAGQDSNSAEAFLPWTCSYDPSSDADFVAGLLAPARGET